MRTIDTHYGPDHRIGRPAECPGCGAAASSTAPFSGDCITVTVSFECGAEVRWRSVGHESGGYSEILVEVRTCQPGLAAVLAKARGACPDLRLGQLVWSAAWLAREQRSGSAPPDDPNLVFYIDDEALAHGLDSIARGSSLPGDEASRTAERIKSYLTRKTGSSLDGEAVDHVARIIRGGA